MVCSFDPEMVVVKLVENKSRVDCKTVASQMVVFPNT